jgi:uncharacterized membrane protein YphA (DoxX/SURF4 family)
MTRQISPDPSATGLRVLSLFLGIFFLFMGLDKLAWLSDPGLLTRQLNDWLQTSPATSRWYLRTIAIPGAPVFAYLVLAGELGTGAALLAGFKPRLAALVGLFMVLNFHFAMGVLLQYSYLWNAYGPPVLGGLLALVIGGARLPFSLGSRPFASARTHDRADIAAPHARVAQALTFIRNRARRSIKVPQVAAAAATRDSEA